MQNAEFWKRFAFDYIDYLIKKYGHKNFGLGTDLFGIEKEFLPTDFSGYNQIENLVNEFRKLNYSQEIIDAILFKNYEDFLLRNNLIPNDY